MSVNVAVTETPQGKGNENVQFKSPEETTAAQCGHSEWVTPQGSKLDEPFPSVREKVLQEIRPDQVQAQWTKPAASQPLEKKKATRSAKKQVQAPASASALAKVSKLVESSASTLAKVEAENIVLKDSIDAMMIKQQELQGQVDALCKQAKEREEASASDRVVAEQRVAMLQDRNDGLTLQAAELEKIRLQYNTLLHGAKGAEVKLADWKSAVVVTAALDSAANEAQIEALAEQLKAHVEASAERLQTFGDALADVVKTDLEAQIQANDLKAKKTAKQWELLNALKPSAAAALEFKTECDRRLNDSLSAFFDDKSDDEGGMSGNAGSEIGEEHTEHGGFFGADEEEEEEEESDEDEEEESDEDADEIGTNGLPAGITFGSPQDDGDAPAKQIDNAIDIIGAFIPGIEMFKGSVVVLLPTPDILKLDKGHFDSMTPKPLSTKGTKGAVSYVANVIVLSVPADESDVPEGSVPADESDVPEGYELKRRKKRINLKTEFKELTGDALKRFVEDAGNADALAFPPRLAKIVATVLGGTLDAGARSFARTKAAEMLAGNDEFVALIEQYETGVPAIFMMNEVLAKLMADVEV